MYSIIFAYLSLIMAAVFISAPDVVNLYSWTECCPHRSLITTVQNELMVDGLNRICTVRFFGSGSVLLSRRLCRG